MPLPRGSYSPLADPTLPPSSLGEALMIWVSSYFDVAHSLDITEPELALRSNNYLDITDPARTPTCKRFTDQELGEITHPAVEF